MNKSIQLYHWIHSIYFRSLHVRCRVLNRGYIGNPADHKIRAVLKDMVQSQSACLDQRHMVCEKCSRREACLFFRLVVDQVEFGPYIIHLDDPGGWRGPMEPSKEQGFEIRLIGNKSLLSNQIAQCLRRKPFFSFDAAGDERVRFELVSVEETYGGKEIRIEDIVESYKSKGLWDGGPVSGLHVEIVTPVEIRKKGRIINNPQDMTFDVFLGALLERINGLVKVHCGFEGNLPSLEDIAFFAPNIVTDNSGMEFTSRKPKGKGYSSMKKSEEYFGGLKGTILFKGDLTPYFPLILLGEAIHVGKKTTQGLGQYSIKTINSPGGFDTHG